MTVHTRPNRPGFAARLGLVAAACLVSVAGAGDTLLFEDFNDQNGGTPTLNFSAFDGWTVSDGTVDLIGGGFFDFYPGNGLFIDMDGSTSDAGVLTSDPIELLAGEHSLTFDMGYNSGGGTAFNEMTIRIGETVIAFYSGNDHLNTETLSPKLIEFTLDEPITTGLVFDHAGGDIGGYIIDNVHLTGPGGTPTCPADLDDSGSIDLADLNIVLADFGCTANCSGDTDDTDDNDTTDLADLNAVLAAFGQDCP